MAHLAGRGSESFLEVFQLCFRVRCGLGQEGNLPLWSTLLLNLMPTGRFMECPLRWLRSPGIYLLLVTQWWPLGLLRYPPLGVPWVGASLRGCPVWDYPLGCFLAEELQWLPRVDPTSPSTQDFKAEPGLCFSWVCVIILWKKKKKDPFGHYGFGVLDLYHSMDPLVPVRCWTGVVTSPVLELKTRTTTTTTKGLRELQPMSYGGSRPGLWKAFLAYHVFIWFSSSSLPSWKPGRDSSAYMCRAHKKLSRV